MNNDPIGEPWGIEMARSDLQPSLHISEIYEEPKVLSLGVGLTVQAVLSLGLWGMIWVAAKLFF